MKKCVLAISAAVLLAATAPAFSVDAVLRKIAASGEIVIGYPTEALPFSYRGADGEPVGYSIDLCRQVTAAIRQELQLPALKIRFHPLSFSERLDAVSGNAVDLECGSTTNTPARRMKVAFSVSTFAATIKAVVRKQDGLRQLKDLDGRTVVIVEGTTVGQLVDAVEKKNGLAFRKVHAKNLSEGFQAFIDTKADGLVFDDVVVAPLIADKPEYAFLDDVLAVEHLGLIFPRDNPRLKRIVDETLAAMMRSGAARKNYEKWFQSPIAPNGLNLNLPFSDDMQALFNHPDDRGNGDAP
jgi:glutamate/aspartate transport system substrate-binding protein